MAKATLSLSAKANNEGEHIIKVRLDITRTNRPQFKSPITIKPEHFVDGQIKIPSRSKLNASYRDCVIKKKQILKLSLPISMLLPWHCHKRQETVRTLWKFMKLSRHSAHRR